MFESRWGWHPPQPLSPAAHQADPLSRLTARQGLSQKAHAQETSDGSHDSEVMQKNSPCLLKFPSSSCPFLFLNILSIYNKYFFELLLDHGLNPRARDEKEIWVKPCKYFAYSIRAQKSASQHSAANSSLTKGGEGF